MYPITTRGDDWEDLDALGPGSLEDLGSSEWLRRFTFISKQHPKYDLNSNKGPFLGGLRFMLEWYHQGSSVETIMTVLQSKNRKFSLNFIEQVVELTTGDSIDIDNHIAGFALILEYNRMGKGRPFIKKRFERLGRWDRFDCFFRDDFVRELICNEKQWELDSLVDIHRQECIRSELSR